MDKTFILTFVAILALTNGTIYDSDVICEKSKMMSNCSSGYKMVTVFKVGFQCWEKVCRKCNATDADCLIGGTSLTSPQSLNCPWLECSYCPYGYQLDINGCRTCHCKTKRPCLRIKCKPCKFGYKLDRNGCQGCQCLEKEIPYMCLRKSSSLKVCYYRNPKFFYDPQSNLCLPHKSGPCGHFGFSSQMMHPFNELFGRTSRRGIIAIAVGLGLGLIAIVTSILFIIKVARGRSKNRKQNISIVTSGKYVKLNEQKVSLA
ncbi:DgyrCDS10665 [Dimorphilus gyrociliatus]|uniref:DgyrCDS10665 n=1 Tax=Dimorphilus gyrociliatus TaxID=2664684 RepID=A0A7I8W3F4_9ANNE|nr:DgyrCDS10665 [Dimorphilus gyrociliatus]